jgi:hypothetical protein
MQEFKSHPLYQRHNIDSAMNSVWDFYKKNFVVLFLTSLVMSLIIQYISKNINTAELQGITDPMEMFAKMKVFIWPMLLITVINLLFTTIMHYYILHHSVDNQDSIITSAIKSLKYFIPYLLIMIVLAIAGTIAMMLGLLVFIVGAVFSLLYVLTLYLMVLPTLMVEGPDPVNAISKAFKLVHRNFWSNIGWVAVFLILLIVISLVLSGVILIPFSGSFIRNLFNSGNSTDVMELAKNPVFMILSAVVNALTFPLMPIFAFVLYFNGRATEEEVIRVVTETDEPKLKVEDLYAKPYSDDHPENLDNINK